MRLFKDRYYYYHEVLQEPELEVEKVTGMLIAGHPSNFRLSNLLKYPHLEAIYFQSRSIHWTQEEMDILKQLPKLKEIEIKTKVTIKEPFYAGLAQVTQLEKLTLIQVYDREVPVEIFQMPNLKSVELYDVQRGSVKEMLSRLSHAKALEHLTLTLWFQKLDEGFPEEFTAEIGNLPQLKSLEFNGFPYLPEEMQRLTQLESLSIERTPIPDWLWNFNRLRSLTLNLNNLTSLPEAFSEFNQLESLNLGRNRIAEIPDYICEFSQLKHLDLTVNAFRKLPDQFGKLKELETLELSTTALESLPDSFAALTKLKPELNLSHTFMTAFPEVLCSLPHFTSIDFSQHKLTTLPDSLVKLVNLRSLDLRKCKFEVFPEVIYKMKSLEHLNLQENPITRKEGKILKKNLDATFLGPANRNFTPEQKANLLILLMEDQQTIQQQLTVADLLPLVENGSKVTRPKALEAITALHPSPFDGAESLQKVLPLGKMRGISSSVINKAIKAAGMKRVKDLKGEPDVVILMENPGELFWQAREAGIPFATLDQLQAV